LERPENTIQKGSCVDMLLHYAVAEFQDAVGLTDERDKTVAAALALESAPIKASEQSLLYGRDDYMKMSEHCYVAWALRYRFRLHWAIPHYRKVIESGHVELRVRASADIGEIASYLADYSLAVASYDKHLEILKNDYRDNDKAELTTQAQRRRTFCLAEQAAAEGNWEGVRDFIKESLALGDPPGSRDYGDSLDVVILAHRLRKEQPALVAVFKEQIDALQKRTWNKIEQSYSQGNAGEIPVEFRPRRLANTFNAAAWLLAKTDGDPVAALVLIESALKIEPEDVNMLDTLAHVYFLGGKVDEAIRTQEKVLRYASEAVIFHNAMERFKKAKNGQ
jgi:tetratricopeptide (TPR) repeat protein